MRWPWKQQTVEHETDQPGDRERYHAPPEAHGIPAPDSFPRRPATERDEQAL